jgi:hypothetical protein
MKRRRWKPEQKALIVLEGLRLDDLGWHALPPLFGAGSRQTEPYLLEHALERVREPDNLPHVLRPAWTVHSLTDAATLLEGVAVVLPAGAPLEAISPSQPARPAWRRSRRSPHREVVAIVQNGPWPGLGIDAAWSDDLVDRLLASYICKAGCRPQAYGYPCHGHGSLHGRRSAAAGPEGRRRRALSGGAAPGPCRLRPSDRCQPWPRGYPAPALVERAAARGHGARGGGLDAEESVLASAVARSERVACSSSWLAGASASRSLTAATAAGPGSRRSSRPRRSSPRRRSRLGRSLYPGARCAGGGTWRRAMRAGRRRRRPPSKVEQSLLIGEDAAVRGGPVSSEALGSNA